MAKIKISLRIDEDILAATKVLAKAQRRSVSAVLVNWIRDSVDSEEYFQSIQDAVMNRNKGNSR